MDRRDISMLYIKDQQVETVKQTEKDDKNCEQPEFKQSKSGMEQNNGLVYKEKQVDIEI